MALQAARAREQTEDFAQEYARRAGIEGALARAIRPCELRRTRYIGPSRVHLGHILTAAALNILRLAEWIADVPRAKTRASPFTLLMRDGVAAYDPRRRQRYQTCEEPRNALRYAVQSGHGRIRYPCRCDHRRGLLQQEHAEDRRAPWRPQDH